MNTPVHFAPWAQTVGDVRITCDKDRRPTLWDKTPPEKLPKGIFIHEDARRYTNILDTVTCRRCLMELGLQRAMGIGPQFSDGDVF